MYDVLARLPDIPCPFTSRQHPAVDLAEAHVRYYGRRHGLVASAASGKRFDRAGYGTFAARTCPDARDVELMAEWAAWLFVFDDEFDESGDPRERASLVDPFLAEVRAVLATGCAPHGGTPTNVLTAALADMWPRTTRLMSPGWRARCARHLCAYIEIYKSDISNRRFGEPPSFEEYLPFRRVVSAVDVCWDMIEVAQEESLPEHIVEHDLCVAVRDAANDITCWTNDIISLNKEHARGDMNNLVAVVRGAQRLSWPEAATRAAAMVDDRTRDFELARRKLDVSRETLRCTDAEWDLLGRCADAMALWMAGSRAWHLSSHRYTDVEHLARHSDPTYYRALLGPSSVTSDHPPPAGGIG